jgi:hypothetical protein
LETRSEHATQASDAGESDLSVFKVEMLMRNGIDSLKDA